MDIKHLLTIDQAAAALGISASRTRHLISEGKLPSEKLGWQRLVPLAAVKTYRRTRRPYCKTGRPKEK